MNQSMMSNTTPKEGRFLALTPLLLFLVLYLVTSLVVGDFYKMPIAVAFVVASVYAACLLKGRTLQERVEVFSHGAADSNILQMIWIFILAGAFAGSAEAMGAIDATVNLTLKLLPAEYLTAGLFLAACFVSISVGTSVGTVVALTPVAAGLADETGLNTALLVATVVGGSFFGDNLSFISDTTIAATRTQGVNLKDKFRFNLRIAAPAAAITLVIYLLTGARAESLAVVETVEWVKVVPYLLVLITALAGVHVMLVLLLGIVSTGAIGLATGALDLFGWCGELGKGMVGMGELIIVTMLAGGMLETIRRGGGIDYIISRLTRRLHGPRAAQGAIAGLVCLANCCTANNTIAILTVGPLAAEIADRFGVDRRKSASLLDSISCFTQGMLPYGAQMLMAAGLASLSPLEIMGHLYYPFALGFCTVISILIKNRRRTA
ncbi:MAG: Na+/H+ antiporter NhaC family protein [Rikenellaceae bacterium]|nr:Na+/H+ antiporter NhaC family protein [Rikenellaceae bacterium]